MSNIPAARQHLNDLSAKLRNATITPADAADEIDQTILPLMHRIQKVRQAPNRSRPMTRKLGAKARQLANSSRLTEAEIAAKLSINPGRVSEALNGKWV